MQTAGGEGSPGKQPKVEPTAQAFTLGQAWGRGSGKGGRQAATSRNIFHQKAVVLGPRPCAWAAKL